MTITAGDVPTNLLRLHTWRVDSDGDVDLSFRRLDTWSRLTNQTDLTQGMPKEVVLALLKWADEVREAQG